MGEAMVPNTQMRSFRPRLWISGATRAGLCPHAELCYSGIALACSCAQISCVAIHQISAGVTQLHPLEHAMQPSEAATRATCHGRSQTKMSKTPAYNALCQSGFNSLGPICRACCSWQMDTRPKALDCNSEQLRTEDGSFKQASACQDVLNMDVPP